MSGKKCVWQTKERKTMKKKKVQFEKVMEKECLWFWNIHAITHSFTIPIDSKSFQSLFPQFPPKHISLIVHQHTNTPLPHSYLSYKSSTIHLLNHNQIPPSLSSFSFPKSHTQSPSLSQNNHFSSQILKINLFLPSLSFISFNSTM